jgi:hypothetical protein
MNFSWESFSYDDGTGKKCTSYSFRSPGNNKIYGDYNKYYTTFDKTIWTGAAVINGKPYTIKSDDVQKVIDFIEKTIKYNVLL